MNRSQQIRWQVAKFLGKDYQVSDSKSKINLLDIYENYLEFIRDNATGYSMPIGDFQKEIKQVYPSIVIGDDKSISGITKRVYKPRPEVVRDHIQDLLTSRLNQLTRGAPESFKASELAGFNSKDNETIELDKVEKYLSNSEMMFFNKHTIRWIRSR